MKYEAHIKTGDFSYLGFEMEGTAQDAVEAYKELQEALKGQPAGEGIGLKALAKVIHEYCTTGGIEDGGNYEFSEKENLLMAEVKKIIRKNA